jgi:hypothetical protein
MDKILKLKVNPAVQMKQVSQSLVRFLNKPLCSCNWKVWIGLVVFGLIIMRLSVMVIPWIRRQWSRMVRGVMEGMDTLSSTTTKPDTDYNHIRDETDHLTTKTSGADVDSDLSSDSSLGIPQSQIPEGQEDLYILKSQVVPPVCPACPPVIERCKNDKDKCPPCRPCGRCPEPDFECKKVPNYSNAQQNSYLPRPVLSDFSQFGM